MLAAACSTPVISGSATKAAVYGQFTLPAHPRVLIVGDSLTAGLYATPTSQGWAYDVVRAEGWIARVIGQGGTGYVRNVGPRPDTFGVRMLRQAGFAPNVVILEGSTNDYWAFLRDPQLVARAVGTAIADARRAFPGAQLLGIGPFACWRDRARMLPLDQTVAASYLVAQVRYLDPIEEEWITASNTSRYARTDDHPNGNVGYAYYASRVIQDIRELAGLPSTTPLPPSVGKNSGS
jgi:lysophospholipase L1-like esterase